LNEFEDLPITVTAGENCLFYAIVLLYVAGRGLVCGQPSIPEAIN
jgi:hypothetical protein